jgi:hypothetical protein
MRVTYIQPHMTMDQATRATTGASIGLCMTVSRLIKKGRLKNFGGCRISESRSLRRRFANRGRMAIGLPMSFSDAVTL